MTVYDVIRDYSSRPFQYGDDCCQFVNDVVRSLTGKHLASAFRYKDEKTANAILDKHGGLEGLLTHVLGEPVNEGRVCLSRMSDGRDIAGVVWRDRIVVRTMTSLVDWPLSRGRLFWSVD